MSGRVGRLGVVAAVFAVPSWPLSLHAAESAESPPDEGDGLEPIDARRSQGPEWAQRKLEVEIDGGLGTPVGYGGLSLGYSPARWIVVFTGAGAGSGPDGVSLHNAAGLRLRLSSSAGAFSMGVSASTGGYKRAEAVSFCHVPGCKPATYRADRVYWINPEVGWEWRNRSAQFLRLCGGAAVRVHPSEVACDAGDGCADSVAILYLGLAVGSGFIH